MLLLFCARIAYGQGAAYTAGPFNQSGYLWVCPVPSGGTPCPSPSNIFTNVALNAGLSNPVFISQGQTVSFYVTPGQYTIQFPTGSYSQVVTIGGGGGGVSSVFTRTGAVTAQSGDYTAAQLGVGALPNGVTATTQAANDNTTNVATDAFVIANNGTGSPNNPAGPVMGFYLSNACPAANNGNCFFTPANTQQDVTASWGTGSGVITITDGKFVSGDVGKRAFGYVTCNAFTNTLTTNATSGAITTGAVVTITGFTDSNHVTISANPANAVSNTVGVGGCFIWGTPDDTGAAAVDTALQASTSCPKLFLAAAYYMFTTPHFFTNPTSCFQTGASYQNPASLANIYYEAGFEIEGRGRANTTWFLTPGFPETGACNHGLASNACFVIPLEGRWVDFSITGGDQSQGTGSTVALVHAIGPSSIDNFNCINWGAGVTAAYGLVLQQGWTQLRQVDISGCGGNGIYVGAAAFPIGYNVRSENSGSVALTVAGTASFECHSCGFYDPQFSVTAITSPIAVFNAGQMTCYNCDVQDGGVGNAAHPRIGVQNQTGAGVWYKQYGGDIHFPTAGNGTAISSLGGDTYLQGVDLSANGTGNTYIDAAASRLFDLGNNTGFTSASGTNISGQVLGQSASMNQSPLVTGNIALSANWGTSNTKTAFLGGNSPAQFTITNGTAATGASPTITYTFPTPYLTTPLQCTATQVGGTNATGTFTSSALSKTSVVFTFSLTPTANSTEIVMMTCTTT